MQQWKERSTWEISNIDKTDIKSRVREMKTVYTKEIIHQNEKRVRLFFDYDPGLIAQIKNIQGRIWDLQGKFWHIPRQRNYLKELNRIFRGKLSFVPLKPVNSKIDYHFPVEYTENLKLKNYSRHTVKTYTSLFNRFVQHHQTHPKEITDEQIRKYLVHITQDKAMSASYQNQTISAIKFYYEQILGRSLQNYHVPRPKKEKKLPLVLSETEIETILRQITNIKHRCIITLIYSSGLRRSELVNLKLEDIDSNRNIIIVRAAKGKKDRITILSSKILKLLREYYREYRPQKWLFEGPKGGKYSVGSVHKIFKKAIAQTKIKKKASIHTLRHSFATHLLEMGTDIRYIQELLGHSSTKTTEIYTHVTTKNISKLKSPFDNFEQQI